MIIKLKSFSALIAKLLQPLNYLTLSNDQNPAKPRHRPFEQSLFLFGPEIEREGKIRMGEGLPTILITGG